MAVVESAYNWSRVEELLEKASYAPPSVRTGEGRHDRADGSENVSEKASLLRGRSRADSAQSVFPGAVILVGKSGEIVYHGAFGCRSVQPEVSPMKADIVFDVASLTKALVTSVLTMQLVERGQLDVDWRLSRIFQTFSTHGKERMTFRHLLAHCSGYPATAPFFRRIAKADRAERSGFMTSRGAAESVYQEIFRAKLEHLPGKVTRYSDIGFMLLGHALEVASGTPLIKLAAKSIFHPLGLASSGFVDLTLLKRQGLEPATDQIAPTAFCSWRGKILCGEVHDDNAWAMGGVAGHAGLFSNALDVHKLASHLIKVWHGETGLVGKEILRKFWSRDTSVPGSTWALGWDTPSDASSSGSYFGPSSVGHLGYTGCSLWIDPERELDVVLLTNRIHPSVENNRISAFRPILHDAVMEALGLASA